MIGPDVSSAQQMLRTSIKAITTATNFAQATLTAVPAVESPPDWFEPIAADLATAQDHANGWIDTTCPAVSTGLPVNITSFNDRFQAAAAQIISQQDAIVAAGGVPTAAQKTAIQAAIADLQNQLSERQAKSAAIGQEVIAYSDAIKADQDRLQADLGVISERFASGGDWITQLTAAMGESFLSTTNLGPCTAIVMISMDISITIQGVGADATVIALVIAKAIVDNQLNNAPVAQDAVQAIIDFWGTLQAKTAAVATDLADAQDTRFMEILGEIDIKVARTQWQQLADYVASQVTDTPDTAPSLAD